MSDIVQYLTGEKTFVETGTVENYLGKGKYWVKLKERRLVIRSVVERLFGVGDRVVINRIGDMRYIVGVTGHSHTATAREVVIDA